MPTPAMQLIEILPPGASATILSISPDGDNVLLESNGLTADDNDAGNDLYNWNVATRTFQLIGQEIAGGLIGSGRGPGGAIYSPDGRYIAFVTDSQLSADDTNFFVDNEGNPHSLFDVYLYDTVTGAITLVTPSVPGAVQPNFLGLQFSGDSSTLVMVTDLKAVIEDDIGTYGVYTYDIATGALDLAAHSDDGFVTLGGVQNGLPKTNISTDGQWIALDSDDQLTSDDVNGSLRDVYLHDSQTGTNILVSKPVTGGLQGTSMFLDMSADGSKLLIWSTAQLSSADTDGGGADVYLWDRASGTSTLITASDQMRGEGAAFPVASISADGSLAVFTTAAALVQEDRDALDDTYLYNVATGAVELLSVTVGDIEGGSFGQLSDDGTVVLINSWAQLTSDDTDVYRDAYLLDLTTGQLTLASADVPNGNTRDYAGLSPDLDTRVLWLKDDFGATAFRWDAASGSTIEIPRTNTNPVGFEFSEDGSAVAWEEPDRAVYWFGLAPGGGAGVTRQGGNGRDVLVGTEADDSLHGGRGRDTLWGLGGDDRLFGDKHRDVIIGGEGDDEMWGGGGKDVFVFAEEDFGADRILDFGQKGGNDDRIDLQALATNFASLDIVYSAQGATITSTAFGSGSIFLADVSQLTASDFIF